MHNKTSILCPNCRTITEVYHLEFDALKCVNCKEYIPKSDWQILPTSELTALRDQIKNSPYTENQLLMAIVRSYKKSK